MAALELLWAVLGLLAWRALPGDEGLLEFPVPGMVLCTGLTERGPKDPEVETSLEL